MKAKTFLFLTALFALNVQGESAKLAIVIDDIGYHQQYDKAIYALPKTVSVAIIPSAPYATQRHHQAQQQGRDVLIHMPMQPLGQQKIEAGGLTLGLSQTEVAQRVKQAKAILPAAIGMNNHMGSAATSDTDLMQKLMKVLAEQQLFFLDSKTIGRSVAYKIAKSQGVTALERHIFLDDKDNYADIQKQLQSAVSFAQKNGTAIAIGHPRKHTVAVLQSGLKNLPANVQLVSIGSLWRNEKVVPASPFIYLFSDKPAPTSAPPYQAIPTLRGVPQ